jgi:hypothetical protein
MNTYETYLIQGGECKGKYELYRRNTKDIFIWWGFANLDQCFNFTTYITSVPSNPISPFHYLFISEKAIFAIVGIEAAGAIIKPFDISIKTIKLKPIERKTFLKKLNRPSFILFNI